MMDRFGRVARLHPPLYDHHSFLDHQERGTMNLGGLGRVFPVGVRGVRHLILVSVLRVLEPVVGVLPPTVNKVLLAHLVL